MEQKEERRELAPSDRIAECVRLALEAHRAVDELEREFAGDIRLRETKRKLAGAVLWLKVAVPSERGGAR